MALVDDSYNANPIAVRAAIDVLASAPGCRRLVLGAMLELGLDEAQLHFEMGTYAQEAGIDELWVVGAEAAPAAVAFGEGAHCFASTAEVLEFSPRLVGANTTLVKASRGARLEVLVSQWLTEGKSAC